VTPAACLCGHAQPRHLGALICAEPDCACKEYRERPTVTLVGNMHDLLGGVGSKVDDDGDCNGNAIPNPVCT
jgi:hypothetical protein